jgi:hypothetical protein
MDVLINAFYSVEKELRMYVVEKRDLLKLFQGWGNGKRE